MKTVYLLIGPKGSGKTYIGKLMEKNLGIDFLSVEEFFIKNLSNPEDLNEKENKIVWREIENEIDLRLKSVNQLSLESIGLFNSFKEFLARLESKYEIKMIRIDTPLNLCYQRIEERGLVGQVKFSKEKLIEINRLSLKEAYNFSLVINNQGLLDDKIIKKIEKII